MKHMQQQASSTAEEMGPVEDVIKAFIDYLVDPLLPLKIPLAPPLLSNQLKVAKQMHAVVLLYNYYQRKRHAQAEYIDFTSFCKLVVTLKPVLAAYMTSMQGSTPTDSENLENQLSVTEKAIQDACKISTSLDVSRDIPDVNEWEVSKVAVFLVDPSKENCALSINLLTDGVWSIFEKSIDHCVDNEDNSKKPNKKKRKRRQATGEPDLQQLAFSALREARGIQQSHLTILERHVTYSLDKERTSACCFIMECQSTNQKFEFSVRDTIESLQGPLVEKINGNWTLTQLIEYYNLLPYAGILSSWFSRQFPLISSELLDASILEKYCGDDVPEYEKPDSESADSTLSELVDVGRQSAENRVEDMDNIISYDCANDIVRGDACEKRYVGAQEKGDSTDLESDKTYDDGNLSKTKSIECRVGYDNGPETENVEGMDVDLSGTLSASEILPQRNKEETMSFNVIGENPDDNVKIALQSSTWRVPEKTCTSLHSENYNPAPVSVISAIDGGLKETEQPSVKEIQPSINFIDGEEITSTNSVGQEVRSFNSFEKPVKEVKDFAKSLDAAESSLTCKLKTNPLVLYDTKVLQQESSGLLVDDTQEASVDLANEVNSTIISLLGDANAESKLKSDESLAKEKDLKLCISGSQFERNSGLLCIDEKNILEKGSLHNEVNEMKATIISQIDDTDDVRSDKSGLKLIAQKDLEHATTYMKPDLVLAAKIPSNCGTIYSSLQKDDSMPITSITSFPLGEGSSDFPLTCPKGKVEILSTKSVIDNNANRKRSRNPEAHATTEYENTEGTSVVDPTINPVESMHSARYNLLSALALRETKPSEASLGFLLHKKNELYHQLQEIQDQIALCDQHIQKISDVPGNKDSLVLKVDTMINCCLDFLKTATEVQCNSYNETGGYGAIQLRRPETTLEPFLSIGFERQELDNIGAPAEQLMSSSNGNFDSRVGAGKVDFKCTGEGGGRFSSHPEMESVAAAGEPMVEPEAEKY